MYTTKDIRNSGVWLRFTWAKSCKLRYQKFDLFQMILLQIFQRTKPLSQIPLLGPLFTPPVNVTAVAKVSVRAATDPVFPPGIIDVHGILRYSQQKSV